MCYILTISRQCDWSREHDEHVGHEEHSGCGPVFMDPKVSGEGT